MARFKIDIQSIIVYRANMDRIERHIATAEHLGWTRISTKYTDRDGYIRGVEPDGVYNFLPNYDSKDEMSKLILSIPLEDKAKFSSNLYSILDRDMVGESEGGYELAELFIPPQMCMAYLESTGEQQNEAYLRTVGKWTGEPRWKRWGVV